MSILLLSGSCLLSLFGTVTDSSESPALSSNQKELARGIADDLEKQRNDLDKLVGLTEEERQEAEKLDHELERTAKKLEALEKESHRDVLEELEARAREAEQLARALGADPDAIGSALLAELERHADTVELAGALRAGDYEKAARAAGALAGILKDKELKLETQQRISTAIEKGLDAATPEDLKTALGRSLSAADAHLERPNATAAGAELEHLKKHYETLAKRMQSKKKLQGLAKKLRQSGQNIFGRKRNVTRTASAGSALQRLSRKQKGTATPLPFSSGGSQGSQLAPLPRSSNSATTRPKNSSSKAPVPGQPGTSTRPGSQSNSGQPGSQGSSGTQGSAGPQGSQGPAPVPGTGGSCSSCSGSGCSSCSGGSSGSSGSSQSGSSSGSNTPAPVPGTGGLTAGNGSAPLGADPTRPHEAKDAKQVNPTVHGDGPSTFRAVGPSDRQENANVDARALAIEFLKAEEAALADEPIPTSRMDEILNYFRDLRARIESEDDR